MLLSMLDDEDVEGQSLTLSFHKKVTGAADPGDTRHHQRIMAARNEIGELIY